MTDDRKTELDKSAAADRIHRDAEPQFARTRHGADNNGVASARPRVITGSDDATVNKWKGIRKDPPKDWSINSDIGTQGGAEGQDEKGEKR
jgi:hypothetical protein